MKQFTQAELDSVFHAYDIRGIVPDQLNDEFFLQLGKAFVTHLNAKKVVVGWDIREDSPHFAKSFIDGVISLGCDVISIGEVSTEMYYYAVGSDDSIDGGAVVTASHNPSEWNGCKMVAEDVHPLSSVSGLPEIKELMRSQSYAPEAEMPGTESQLDAYPAFRDKIRSFCHFTHNKRIKLVVDAGNGIGGKIFDYVFDDLNADIIRMYFEPDGDFPNHIPNPAKYENVKELIERVKIEQAHLGIAFDGDSDRVMFIDPKGRHSNGAYIGSIIARHLLKSNPGARILHDPRITWAVRREVEKAGGTAITYRAGHAFLKKGMNDHQALMAIEMSSHFFYKDFYNADSSMVTIEIMLDILAQGMDFEKEIDYYFEKYPISGEVNYKDVDVEHVLSKLEEQFSDGTIDHIDGLSVEYDDWRFNIRPSNTEAIVRLNIEALTKDLVKEKFYILDELIDGARDNAPAFERA